jgi:hypothetical protein
VKRDNWIAIFLSALYIYLSILVWKKQGFDVTLEALTFIVTGALWLVLILAIRRNHSDARRAGSLLAQIVTIKDEHETQMGHLKRQHLTKLADLRSQLSEDCEKQKEKQRTWSRESTMFKFSELQERHREEMAGTGPPIEIFSPFDGSEVCWHESVAGVVRAKGIVQVFLILEDGSIWRQWPPDIRGSHWRARCQFGDRDRPHKRYTIVANVGAEKTQTGVALPGLPLDGINSAPVQVVRTE